MRSNHLTFIAAALPLALAACSSMDHESHTVPDGAVATIKAPSELKVVEMEGGGHLTWKDNSDNEDMFMIERKDGTADYKVLDMVDFDTTQYHDIKNLAAGTTYKYRLMAMGKKAGEISDYSNEVTFKLGSGGGDGGASEASDASHGHM